MSLTIAAFWPPPPHETTPERYQQIADAGIDLVITGNYLSDKTILKHTLDCADKAGIGVLVASDPRVDVAMRDLELPAEQLRELMGRVVDDYEGYASFRGISLMDEPYPDSYARLAVGVEAVRDRGHLAYVNLFPSHATGEYDAYVGQFVDQVRPDLVSFDRYPFLSDGEDDGYFADLALIRDHATRAGVPAWMYVQTLGYEGHRTPTAAEMAWQVNTALAYGYTGIQYFTYWTPDPARGEHFRPALLQDGEPTERYDAVRQLNNDWLRPVGAELSRLTWRSVGHMDATVSGAKPLAPETVASGSVVVGHYDDQYGAEHLFVCNASFGTAAAVTMATTGLSVFDPVTSAYQDASATFELDPGAACLLRRS